MSRRLVPWCWALFGLGACEPIEDQVFVARPIDHEGEPVLLAEGAGAVDVPVRLARVPSVDVSAHYHFSELEAQTSCQEPDFVGIDGRVVWPAGTREASISLRVGDDDLPELDEALSLTLDDFEGGGLSGSELVRLVILDDDRTGIVSARESSGFSPGSASDQAALLQQALDLARDLGRGVVEVAAGDYDVSSVTLHAGTTLSGRGARFFRPVAPGDVSVGVTLVHRGANDSESTLLEGITLDGRRDEQGAYQGDELADAHLVALRGDATQPGRLRASVESVRLESSTASGVFVGPGVDTTLCRLHGENLWRDVVTLRGGGTRLDAREVDASASLGTTGLWLDGQPAGYAGTHRIEVTVRDTQLASGDLEIEAYDGSSIELERFGMARGPLRIQAPDGSVRITDSVLQTGLPSAVHNFFGLPHDVTLTRTTLVGSETDETGLEPAEADRTLSIASVRWDLTENEQLPPLLPAARPPHRITFDQCTFLRGPNLEPSDAVYAVESTPAGGSVTLASPTLDGAVEPQAPSCEGCSIE